MEVEFWSESDLMESEVIVLSVRDLEKDWNGMHKPSDFVTVEGEKFWFSANDGSIEFAELVGVKSMGVEILFNVKSEFCLFVKAE